MIKCPITGINLKFRGGYFRRRENTVYTLFVFLCRSEPAYCCLSVTSGRSGP